MMSESKRPARRGETPIEKQIREAIDRGEFDRLPGRGKPLDLSENPYTPADWRMAYKLLQDAGMAPDWIEQDKEIRGELSALALWIERQAQWQRARRSRLNTLALHRMIEEREHLAFVRERVCVEYRERATMLNKIIDVFNLKVPGAELQRERIRVDDEIQRFRDACDG
jgi:DnaJ family protein C protein 28